MDPTRRRNDAECASAGDADALQRLIVRCHEPLRRAVVQARSAAMSTHIDPDDVLQQAYVTAFKALCERSADDVDSHTLSGADADGPAARRPAERVKFENTEHFYAWLETVALHRLRDAERALRRQKRDVAREVALLGQPCESYPDLVRELAGDDPTPSRAVARNEAVAAVMSSLARLPDNQRKVIRWRFLQGVSFTEIAHRLDKSEDAAYMLCHRGLKMLRGLLVSITRYLTKL